MVARRVVFVDFVGRPPALDRACRLGPPPLRDAVHATAPRLQRSAAGSVRAWGESPGHRGGPMAVRGTRTAGGKAPDGFLEINADFIRLKADVILAGGRGKGDDIQDGWRPVRNPRPQLAHI